MTHQGRPPRYVGKNRSAKERRRREEEGIDVVMVWGQRVGVGAWAPDERLRGLAEMEEENAQTTASGTRCCCRCFPAPSFLACPPTRART